MPVLDLYEDENRAAAMAAPPVAPRKQDPAFSAWATVKSAVKAVPAAVAEVTGSTADILGAFGGVAAATGGSAGGMFSTGTEAERKQTADAAKKLREQGPDYRTEAGGLFRGVAKDYMPDATTAHGAEVAVADFVRMATKAVAGGVVAGPVAGALAAGAEEGFTAADKLADQGVDVNTRTQVGLVTGAVTGLGFALPVAGRTVGRTVGLALAGGPASFMAQNAATREILQRADYTQLADQYDPFDPVGLTLSTLVPLGFGALAMRGAARRAAAGQPVPEMAPVAPDVVDAARVQLLRENVEAHRATPPEDFAAAQAHEAAVAKALDQLANGQRVEVQDIPDAALVQITETMRMRLEPARAEVGKVPDLAEFIDVQGIDVAAPAAQATTRGNAFVSWIKSVGGIDAGEKFDIVGEQGIRGNYAGIFTKGGKALDVLAEDAVQAGYLSRADVEAATDTGGTRALSELIRRATTGEKVLTVEQAEAAMMADAQARGARTAAEQMERELIALGVDPTPARGNADALGQYLAENRTALVNAKLAELDAQLQQVRIEIGEAYDLNPKQIDQQQRIALAAELDEAAVERAAIQAADEIDFLNRIEEILSHEPRSAKADAGGQGPARDPAVQAGDAAQGAAADAGTAAQPARFDIDAIARQAADFLSDGRSPAEVIGRMQASGQTIAPELQNMIVGAAEFGRRMPELVDQFRALEARNAGAPPQNLIADAGERMRAGQPVDAAPAKTSDVQARLDSEIVGNPAALETKLPTAFDDAGKVTETMTAREFLDAVKAEADQEAADANLLQVAATCFLTSGA